jgi:sec-independent protein translocase protein TatA
VPPLNPLHIIIILVLGVLIFGKNLPDVARQIGSALLEFRKGLNEWKEEHGRSSGSNVAKTKTFSVKEEESVERFESLGTRFEPPSEGG